MLERAGKVVVEAVPDVKEKTLMDLITKTIEPGSLIYSDGFSGYSFKTVSLLPHKAAAHPCGVPARTQRDRVGCIAYQLATCQIGPL